MDDQRRDLRECDGCGATMRFVRTTKGGLLPINPQPDPEGNVRLRQAAGGGRIAEVMNKQQLAVYRGVRYKAHFATCPAAKEFSRKRHGRTPPLGRKTR